MNGRVRHIAVCASTGKLACISGVTLQIIRFPLSKDCYAEGVITDKPFDLPVDTQDIYFAVDKMLVIVSSKEIR